MHSNIFANFSPTSVVFCNFEESYKKYPIVSNDDEQPPAGSDADHSAPSLRTAASSAPAESAADATAQDYGNGPTDDDNSLRFARRFSKEAKYVTLWNAWAIYDGKKWTKDNREKTGIMRLATEVARSIEQESKFEAAAGHDEAAKALLRWSQQSRNATRLNAMIDLARSVRGMTVSPSQFDANPDLINFPNGTYDLASHTFSAHKATDYLTKCMPYEYDPAARCEKSLDRLRYALGLNRGGPEERLKGVMGADATEAELRDREELVDYVQRVAGRAISGRTDDKAMFFLSGPTNSAKSSFTGLLEAMSGYRDGDNGGYCGHARISILMRKRSEGGNTPELATLPGVHIAICSEASDGHTFDDAFVKDVTGGDVMTCCAKFEDPVSFSPRFTLFAYGNARPKVQGGGDDAFWRRFIVIPFAFSIPVDRQINRTQLKDELRMEAAGLFNWAVEGLKQLKTHPIHDLPKLVKLESDSYRSATDTLGEFVQECTFNSAHLESGTIRIMHPDPARCELVVSHKSLYAAYQFWARERGHEHIYRAEDLRKKLEDRGFKKSAYHPGNVSHHAGITLRPKVMCKWGDGTCRVGSGPMAYDRINRHSIDVRVEDSNA